MRFDDFSLADQCYITAKIITARENEREREKERGSNNIIFVPKGFF